MSLNNLYYPFKIIKFMVLESILNPKNAEDKPLHVFVIAFLYSFVAVVFAHQLFPQQSSILAVALVTIMFVPFFQKLFEIEEKIEDLAAEKKITAGLFQRHKKIIFVFSSFFLGIIFSMSFTHVFLGYNEVFSMQTKTIEGFSATATGYGNFERFFANNSRVMLLTFLLSTMFGAGAVLILAWNASVIAVYIGLLTKPLAAQIGGVAYLYTLPIGLGSIALHGIPEIVAYFIAGLAGGILSVGMIRERIGSREFSTIVKDSLLLLCTAEILIFVAAGLEAFL